ncbi:MAG: hypothetical protein PWQ91_1059 [Eubacteriales bacterium]|nr:hypothetical protein [Eubacteriales bacterium]MDN5363998.1 hypothetical protein [Eubacteriales bacterium]
MFAKEKGWQQWLPAFLVTVGLLFLFFAAFYLAGFFKPEKKPLTSETVQREEEAVVGPGTRIRREVRYACGDVLTGELNASDYSGMKVAQLARIFAVEGWKLVGEGEQLLLTRKEKGLCPLHAGYRHLGVKEGKIVVFAGPLGYEGELLQREDIPVDRLPARLQEMLQQAAEYHKQPEEVKKVLRRELEFSSEAALKTALENMDEYKNGSADR